MMWHKEHLWTIFSVLFVYFLQWHGILLRFHGYKGDAADHMIYKIQHSVFIDEMFKHVVFHV
jgi:hypothetical protein